MSERNIVEYIIIIIIVFLNSILNHFLMKDLKMLFLFFSTSV